jgi:hypothetical protein
MIHAEALLPFEDEQALLWREIIEFCEREKIRCLYLRGANAVMLNYALTRCRR